LKAGPETKEIFVKFPTNICAGAKVLHVQLNANQGGGFDGGPCSALAAAGRCLVDATAWNAFGAQATHGGGDPAPMRRIRARPPAEASTCCRWERRRFGRAPSVSAHVRDAYTFRFEITSRRACSPLARNRSRDGRQEASAIGLRPRGREVPQNGQGEQNGPPIWGRKSPSLKPRGRQFSRRRRGPA